MGGKKINRTISLDLLLPAPAILEKSGPGGTGVITVTGLSYHSARVTPGNLFVAIRGYKTDGHLFLAQAAARGAAAAVVEEIQPGINLPQFRVADCRQALAGLANRYYGHPSRMLKIIGVTATNGKTTTAFMTNAILEEYDLKTGLIGTVIVKIGKTIRPAVLTTPESLDLHHCLAQMTEHDITHVTMEASSSGLALHRVDAVNFDIVVMNNISREHIDLHGDFERYHEAKARLVRERLPHQWAVLNLDCPLCAALAGNTAARVLTYGVKESGGHFQVRDLDLSTGRAAFTVELLRPFQVGTTRYTPSFSFPVRLSVLGLHSVYNAMAAILVGLLNEVPVSTIQAALHKFRGVERRFELIFDGPFKIIDDHFANSGNIEVTLETLKYMDYRRLTIIYAIRGSRGVIVNRENAETLARWAPLLGVKEIIATTSRSDVTEKDIVTAEELAVYRKVMQNAGIKTIVIEELPAAIATGLSRLESGDVLLLAGCQGMDPGAHLALEQVHHLLPHLPREQIYAALENRVAGV